MDQTAGGHLIYICCGSRISSRGQLQNIIPIWNIINCPIKILIGNKTSLSESAFDDHISKEGGTQVITMSPLKYAKQIVTTIHQVRYIEYRPLWDVLYLRPSVWLH